MIIFTTFFYHNTLVCTNDFTVDFVIYTFDRPMQAYALLESSEKFLSGLGDVYVICRTSSADYLKAYKEVASRFSGTKFVYQGDDPHKDFKPLMMRNAFGSDSRYIMFGVDDIIVKDYVNVKNCAKQLEKTLAYGFYLRLGHNITECYSENKATPLPPHTSVCKDIFQWEFKNGDGDWRYPNSNDMTIFKKADIIADLSTINFTSTEYEGPWADKADLNKKGLFFTESKIVGVPLNIVNEKYPNNRQMNAFTAQELLEKFNSGLKIDIIPFYRVSHKAPHSEFEIKFIKR